MFSRFNISFFLIIPVIKRLNGQGHFIPTRNITKFKILGIETSCDDTAAAVVDSEANILGEARFSQQATHLELGGIVPSIAKELHKLHISEVVDKALLQANCTVKDVDAVAVTMKPGLELSLWVGMTYGKHLSQTFNKPFIPIHHMEAHALTPRLLYKDLEFPFLVLLVSGGHCLLSLAKSVTEFYTLGKHLDDAPGEAFDKVARSLKLRNLEPYKDKSGGEAIELASQNGDPTYFETRLPVLVNYRSCDFSFSGLKNAAFRKIKESEEAFKVKGSGVVPDYPHICASFQLLVAKHICERLQRAILFLNEENVFPPDMRKRCVVSGGVASNKYIIDRVSQLCSEFNFETLNPEPALCTDNGVMIAWNGVELWRQNAARILYDPSRLKEVDIQARCPFGEDWREKVVNRNIKIENRPWLRS